MTVLTAVSNPMVTSVPRTSLSIVLGIPTTGTPVPLRWRAAPSVSSPPIAMTASIRWRASVALIRSSPDASFIGLVRDVPRTVPPFGRIPEIASRESGTVSSAMSPRHPSRTPITSSDDRPDGGVQPGNVPAARQHRDAPDRRGRGHQAAAIGVSSTPSRLIDTRTTSPARSHRGGFRANPTPLGVPVAIRSPGSSVSAWEM